MLVYCYYFLLLLFLDTRAAVGFLLYLGMGIVHGLFLGQLTSLHDQIMEKLTRLR